MNPTRRTSRVLALVPHATRLACLAAPLLLPSGGAAQDVRGVLRAEISGAPMEGVVVTAMRAADRAIVGRALSSSAGSFRLTVGTDSVVVLALRIGQRPVELWRGRVSMGESRDIGRTLADVPVSITTLRVQERARCGTASDDESSVTRTLFADALTALSASIGSAQGEALVVRTVLTEEFRDLRGNVQRVSAPVVRTGSSTQPFRSVPVPSLLREGFVVQERDGSVTYRAPDAQVLTSDAFLARYCLSLDVSRESDGLVGIGFAPQRTVRSRADVRGTLWLELSTRALQRLEFGYEGLSSPESAADPGGTVEYTQLADGRWIIDRWSLRMPLLATEVSGAMRIPRTRATGVQEIGGMVLEARLRDALLYSVGGPVAEQAIGARLDNAFDRAAAASVLAEWTRTPACTGTDAATAHVAGVVRRTDGTPVVGARVEAEWRTRFRNLGNSTSWAWELANTTSTTGPDGTFQLCGVPRETRVSVQAHTDVTRSRMMLLRLPATGALGEVELTMPAARRVP
jgi:hypothetical protein